MSLRIAPFIFLLWALCTSTVTFGQISDVEKLYGKNRLQYEKFRWRYINTSNFQIFYYDKGYQIATKFAEYAEQEYFRIVNLVGFSPYEKISVFLYTSTTDLLQSNIGINYQQYSRKGQTAFIRSEIEIAFTGEENRFKKEIVRSVSDVLIFQMIYSFNLKDFIKNQVLFRLPEWYLAGASRYIAEGWSMKMDDYMRHYFNGENQQNRKKLHKIKGEDAAIIGQSIWNYIALQYGTKYISDILNLTRLVTKVPAIISTTLQVDYDTFIKGWEEYYTNNVAQDWEKYSQISDSTLLFKKKKNILFNDIVVHPTEPILAYTQNKNGKYKIYLLDLVSGKKQLLFKTGYRLINQKSFEHIPSIAWSKENELFVMGTDEGDNYLWRFDFVKDKPRLLNKRHFKTFNNIEDFDVSENGNFLVISGERNGKSDLFLHDYKNRKTRNITNDSYDNMSPQFLPNSNQIVFSSNRPVTNRQAVPKKKEIFNLYFYYPDSVKNPVQPITQNLSYNTKIQFTKPNEFLFLSNQKGIFQLYSHDLNKNITKQILDFGHSIETFSYSKGDLFFTAKKGVTEGIYRLKNIDTDKMRFTDKTVRKGWLELLERRKKKKEITMKKDTTQKHNKDGVVKEVDTDNYVFSKLSSGYRNFLVQKFAKEKKDKNVYSRSYPYEPQFAIDKTTLGPWSDPLIGASNLLIEFKMTDIFENHKINFGILGLSMKNGIVYAQYLYLKKKWDYKAQFERKAIDRQFKYELNSFSFSMSRPFGIISRASFTPFINIANVVRPASGAATAQSISEYYAGLRTEFVLDDTLIGEKNSITGTRMNVGLEFSYSWQNGNRSFGKFSVDLRHYQPIIDEIILAGKLNLGYFFGPSPKKYMMGNVDQVLNNKFETHQKTDNPLSKEIFNTDLLFHQFVTPLRGFYFNKIYGNSQLLANAELRIPIVRYLYPHDIRSNFIRNLQFNVFFDFGSTWSGGSPFSQSQSSIRLGQFNATVFNYDDPFIMGYGVGVRTVILGYYLKVDYSIGIENKQLQTPIWQLSWNYDF